MSLSGLSVPEVDYDRTALKTVVCQLQFNPILRIGKDEPAEFQDAIREAFPIFERREGQMLSFSFGASPAFEHSPTGATYLFKSEDEAWTASLGNNFVSMETSRYVHFGDFMEKLLRVKSAAEDEYKIPSYTRAGLRYINTFTAIDFPGGWAGRFNPALLGALADPGVADDIVATQQLVRFGLAEGYLNLRHGLGPEGSYTIDLDRAFEDKIECASADALLEEFNRRIFQAFRWSISTTLHEEMSPHAR